MAPPLPGRRRPPVAWQKLLVEPDRQTAPFYQGPIIFRPVGHPILDFRGSGFRRLQGLRGHDSFSVRGFPNYLDPPEGIYAPTPITDEISALPSTAPWKNLSLIGLVESERTVGGETTLERRFFISSLEKEVTRFAQAVRQHWGIENSVHWVLDIGFREDESRIRTGHAPENMAVLRHIALNVLRNDDTRLGIKNQRLKAGWDTDYLTHLLCGELERLLIN